MSNLSSHKEINIPWIGDIPTGWSTKPLKHILSEKKSTKNPDVSSGSISFGKVIYKDDEKIPVSTKESYQEVLYGEFLINPLNLNYDLKSLRIGLSRINVVVSQGYIVLRINDGFIPEYYEYLLRKFDVEHMKSLGQGVRQTISFTHIKDEKLVVPPLKEQKLISRYLDKKTEQIDRLVEKIQNKIELLKEQRTSLINQCVTKGLEPNVEMKDSGVEWIGEIPKHWTVTKLGFLGQFSNGVSKGSEFFGNGSPFINYSDVYKNDIVPKPSGLFRSSEKDWETYSVEKGDIFFTRTSETVDDIGVSSVCMETIDHCCFSGFLVKFRPNDNTFNTKYSRYYFRSSIPLTHYTKEMNLVTRASLSQGTLKTTPILIPPTIEQIEITQYLTRRLGIIDEIFRVETDKIKVLKEYRQSLISSVVTGKVRVTEDMV